MKIEIQHIPSVGAELSFRKPAKEFSVLKEMMDTAECGPFAPIDVRLIARVEGDLIVVEGVLTTAVELACSRCVETFEYPIQRRFTLRFSREIPEELSGGGEEETELTAEQIGLIYFRGETIDLKDAIQEQVVMALPFKPLCSEECKGLCPRCGANLNVETCGCAGTDVSSPFAVLKNFKLPSQ
jgi:uncharacterized protein